MMTAILKKVEDGIQPPVGSTFPVFAHVMYNQHMSSTYLVDTGLEIGIPIDCTLHVVGTPKLIPLSWTLGGFELQGSNVKWPEGRLLLVMWGNLVDEGTKVADVSIVQYKPAPIRFMQYDPSGGRIVRGDAQVANSTENRESES